MATRDAILSHLHTFLEVEAIRDYGPQGLQVEGAEEVDRIVTGVSACMELFEAAVEARAQMVMVHHGMFWDRDPRVIRGPLRRRLEILFANQITLAGYHLCLDRHEILGNNILAAQGLGLQNIQPFGMVEGCPIGFRGDIWSTSLEDLVRNVNQMYDADALVFPYGPDEVRTVGIISGGAQRELHQAIEAGLDMYITGEASEFVMNTAREARIHYVAAGHYNTERLGIKALGDHVGSRFGVESLFVDIPNPV